MGRSLAIVVAFLALSAPAAHADVVISEATNEWGGSATLIDATAVDAVDLRVSVEADGMRVTAGGAEVSGPDDRCSEQGTVARCQPMGDLLVRLGEGSDRASVFGFGAGVLMAGGGDDVLVSDRSFGFRLDGGSGYDQADLSAWPHEGRFDPGTTAGIERLTTGNGPDYVEAPPGQSVETRGGDDHIIATNGTADTVSCGDGKDVAEIDPSDQVDGCETAYTPFTERQPTGVCMLPMPGSDRLVAGAFGDRCFGSMSDDDIQGTAGNDDLDGGPGDDRVSGLLGDDAVRGGSGDDRTFGGPGRDSVVGGSGADRLDGGRDRDVLSGGRGADRLLARGGGADRVDCGPGRDVAVVDARDTVRGCERVRRSG